jgi:hypothetical protein
LLSGLRKTLLKALSILPLNLKIILYCDAEATVKEKMGPIFGHIGGA